jgi:hypothetical protein
MHAGAQFDYSGERLYASSHSASGLLYGLR